MSKKRSFEMALESTVKKPVRANNWSLALVESIKDSSCVVKQSEGVVVIRDKYPKAKIHYLILPQENINSVSQLNSTHINLIEQFGKVFEELKEEHQEYTLRAGFHAVPSMQRLHMHVISKDMISPCLKTWRHWNTFNTKFFIPYEELLEELKEKGSIKKMTTEEEKALMKTPLKCNQCNYLAKTVNILKEHLLSHCN